MCFDLGHSHIFLWRHGLGLNHWQIGRPMYILKDTKMVLDSQNLQVHQTPTIKSYTPAFDFNWSLLQWNRFWKISWCDHQVRAKHQSIQSIAESNTASQGNLLWWCHPCGLQFPEMWSGNLWCPNLPQNEQLEFKNYRQNLIFAIANQKQASFSSCHVWWNNV